MPARKRGQRPLPHALGLKDIEPLPAAGGAGKLAAFAVYRPGSLAPWWLHQGVCAAWGLDVFRTELRLVTVSENATFSVLVDEKPYAMARVSHSRITPAARWRWRPSCRGCARSGPSPM